MINEQIRDKEVRLIGEDGEQMGIVTIAVAQAVADERGLDLVKIAPTANPPVCKIMDYGKYRFDQSKREKEQRKNQTVVEMKEVQLSATIDTHDMEAPSDKRAEGRHRSSGALGHRSTRGPLLPACSRAKLAQG